MATYLEDALARSAREASDASEAQARAWRSLTPQKENMMNTRIPNSEDAIVPLPVLFRLVQQNPGLGALVGVHVIDTDSAAVVAESLHKHMTGRTRLSTGIDINDKAAIARHVAARDGISLAQAQREVERASNAWRGDPQLIVMHDHMTFEERIAAENANAEARRAEIDRVAREDAKMMARDFRAAGRSDIESRALLIFKLTDRVGRARAVELAADAVAHPATSATTRTVIGPAVPLRTKGA